MAITPIRLSAHRSRTKPWPPRPKAPASPLLLLLLTRVVQHLPKCNAVVHVHVLFAGPADVRTHVPPRRRILLIQVHCRSTCGALHSSPPPTSGATSLRTVAGGVPAIAAGRHDRGRRAERKCDITVASLPNLLDHFRLFRDVRPVRDYGHHAVLANADEDMRLIADLCAHDLHLA